MTLREIGAKISGMYYGAATMSVRQLESQAKHDKIVQKQMSNLRMA